MRGVTFIEKLLDGAEVEWLPLAEGEHKLAELKRGRVMSKGYLVENAGDYPVYSSQTANNGQIGQISTFDFEGEYITWTTDGANAGTVFHRSGKFSITNVCGIIKICDLNRLNYRYLFHWLSFNTKKHVYSGMGNPKLMSNQMAKVQIPIPCPDNPEKSLAIQVEIARILDTFTELTTELTTELSARRKQYNYYRDQLLTFAESEVEYKALKEVAEYSKERISSKNVDEQNYVGVDNLLQNREGKTSSSYVPTEGNLTAYKCNDILIGNIRPYLKKIWHSDREGGTNGDVLIIHPTDKSITPRYLYQILAGDSFFEYNIQHSKGAKMPRGNKPKIMEYEFPVPFPNDPEKSLAEQNRIAGILDKFDTMTHSISEGLPKEIKLRQKQYEYYRGLLLNFPKPDMQKEVVA